MIKPLSKIFRAKEIMGVEATWLPDEKISFQGVQLSIKKDLLVAGGKFSGIEGVENLQAVVNRNIPVSLSLNGKGILHKKIMNGAGDIRRSLLAVLPNVKLDDFYIQEYYAGTHVLVSLIRKTVLHDLLNLLKANSIFVAHVTLGPFGVEKILHLTELREQKLKLGSHILELKDQYITDYSYEKSEYLSGTIKIEQEEIAQNLVVAYAAALQLLLEDTPVILNVPQVIAERHELFHKKVFNTVGVGVLIFFLIVLVINFAMFTHYSQQHDELSAGKLKYTSFIQTLDTLTRKVEEREAFLTTAGWMQPSRISFYADRIAETVPVSISLKEMTVNPLREQTTRGSKKLTFATRKVNISGNCSRPTDLNPWIEKMRALDWINAVEIQHYTYDSKDSKGIFLITVVIKS